MRDDWQNDQLELAFAPIAEGEARGEGLEGTESLTAKDGNESLAEERLMEEVLNRENLKKALERVQGNKGSPGVDGMNVDELSGHLRRHWPKLREHLLNGRYRPQPVLRKEIRKRDGGGMRQLGIPTVRDRLIQQALHQVLQERWDASFSEHSYGFRPKRQAHQAVAAAQRYIREGYDWVVDIDLEKFFDRVNHDRLMSRVADRVKDKRVLKLIRAFLNAGVMDAGLVSPTNEGTPQGGPLSPLLSNLVLDELDQELERRGHRFCRYADDCNIYVRTERAGHRVMKSISGFLTNKLRLKVNERKSAVDRPGRRKFLGFRLTNGMSSKRCIATAVSTAIPSASPEADQSDGGEKQGGHRGTTELVFGRMERLLPVLSNSFGSPQHGFLDSTPAPANHLGTVENSSAALPCTTPSGRFHEARRLNHG